MRKGFVAVKGAMRPLFYISSKYNRVRWHSLRENMSVANSTLASETASWGLGDGNLKTRKTSLNLGNETYRYRTDRVLGHGSFMPDAPWRGGFESGEGSWMYGAVVLQRDPAWAGDDQSGAALASSTWARKAREAREGIEGREARSNAGGTTSWSMERSRERARRRRRMSD